MPSRFSAATPSLMSMDTACGAAGSGPAPRVAWPRTPKRRPTGPGTRRGRLVTISTACARCPGGAWTSEPGPALVGAGTAPVAIGGPSYNNIVHPRRPRRARQRYDVPHLMTRPVTVVGMPPPTPNASGQASSPGNGRVHPGRRGHLTPGSPANIEVMCPRLPQLPPSSADGGSSFSSPPLGQPPRLDLGSAVGHHAPAP